MKKMITKILLAATAFVVSFGFVGASAHAYAESPAVIESQVLEKNGENLETEINSEAIEENISTLPENGAEMPESDHNEPSEENPNSSGLDEKTENDGHTFEEFLAWVEKEADRYGYGNEYDSALETIKTAATEKQVTLAAIGSFLLMAAVIVYTIYKKITDKKLKDGVIDLFQSVNDLREKLNELVDGTNSNTKTEEEIKTEERALKVETTKIKNALENLINGFMHFSGHVGMSNTNKEEIQRDCMKALNCIDGGVHVDEDDKE